MVRKVIKRKGTSRNVKAKAPKTTKSRRTNPEGTVNFKVVSRIPYGPYANSSIANQVRNGLKSEFGSTVRMSANIRKQHGVHFTGTLTHLAAFTRGSTTASVKAGMERKHPGVHFTVTRHK